jgi:thiol-disulfide isomerase/thioredoxin
MQPSASVFASTTLLASLIAAATASASQAPIKRLSRSNWFDYVSPDKTVFIQVFIPSCKHCKAMEPMWQEIANQLRSRDSDVLVARLDAAADNGIARTLGVDRYPSQILLSGGEAYEYRGPRGLRELIAFADGGFRTTISHKRAPLALQENASNWWLIAEMAWGPLKLSLSLSLGIVLCLKGIGKVGLWYLKRDPDYRDPDDDSDAEPAPARVETEESKKTL